MIKMIEITRCYDCKHCNGIFCPSCMLKKYRQINDATMIPSWCPLPNKPKE